MKPPVKLKLRSRHWIVNENDEVILGNGRMEILANIEKTGSINQAAKAMKMSYKGAWSKIKATEKHLHAKIVLADKRTGTRLTEEGKALVDKYKRLHQECCRADDDIFNQIFPAE